MGNVGQNGRQLGKMGTTPKDGIAPQNHVMVSQIPGAGTNIGQSKKCGRNRTLFESLESKNKLV